MNESSDELLAESDELLAADELRLPESANTQLRLLALRTWLDRRSGEAELEVGIAALGLQEAMRESEQPTRPRRRLEQQDFLFQRSQLALASAQQSQSAYAEARVLLEDCVAHTTTGERLLVEYYLSLEELIEAANTSDNSPWFMAMSQVLSRVEQVGRPGDDLE